MSTTTNKTTFEVFASNADYDVLVLKSEGRSAVYVFDITRTSELVDAYMELWNGQTSVAEALDNWEASEGTADDWNTEDALVADQRGVIGSYSCSSEEFVQALVAKGVPVVKA